jgi:hypothetical protein
MIVVLYDDHFPLSIPEELAVRLCFLILVCVCVCVRVHAWCVWGGGFSLSLISLFQQSGLVAAHQVQKQTMFSHSLL